MDATRWNRIRYTLWAPLYDVAVRAMRGLRRRSLRVLDARPGERVLVVGAGTGEDLPLLPEGVVVLATDLTPAMLERARAKARPGQELRVMDGQALDLPDASFDAVVLHLIVTVLPDPVRCLAEASRVLRVGGRMVILDKFVRRGARPPLLRRLANRFTRLLFTDITLELEPLLERSSAPLAVVSDEWVSGFFRVVLLRKEGAPPPRGQTPPGSTTG